MTAFGKPATTGSSACIRTSICRRAGPHDFANNAGGPLRPWDRSASAASWAPAVPPKADGGLPTSSTRIGRSWPGRSRPPPSRSTNCCSQFRGARRSVWTRPSVSTSTVPTSAWQPGGWVWRRSPLMRPAPTTPAVTASHRTSRSVPVSSLASGPMNCRSCRPASQLGVMGPFRTNESVGVGEASDRVAVAQDGDNKQRESRGRVHPL
jgi:hypothetical protein